MSTETVVNTPDPAKSLTPNPLRLGLNRTLLIKGAALTVIVLVVGLFVPTIITDKFYMSLVFDSAVLSILGLSVGFLAKHLGLLSLGQAAFFGGAAYAYAIGMNTLELSPLAAVSFGFVFGVTLSIAFGFLLVKATGMGFLMLTVALGQSLYVLVLQNWFRPVSGATDGLIVSYSGDQTFLGFDQAGVMKAADFWPVAWIVLVVTAFVLWMIGRSKLGVVLEGIRENELRMRFSGYNTIYPRWIALVISGTVATIAGLIFAVHAAYVSPETLSFARSGDALIASIIGGLGTLLGPVLGAFIFIFAETRFNIGGNVNIYMGVFLILVLVFLPGGITGGIGQLRRRFFARKARQEESA